MKTNKLQNAEFFYSTSARNSAVDSVTNFIRNAILMRQFPARTMLKEVQLAEMTESSRGVIRAALQNLEYEGLVETLDNGRKKVADFSAKHISDLYEMRKLLEIRSVRQLLAEDGKYLKKYGSELFSSAIETYAFSGETTQTPAERVRADAMFHRMLIKATENHALFQCWNSIEPVIWSLLNINAAQADREKHFEQFRTHDTLIKMLLNNDKALISKLEEHIEISEKMAIETFERLGMLRD